MSYIEDQPGASELPRAPPPPSWKHQDQTLQSSGLVPHGVSSNDMYSRISNFNPNLGYPHGRPPDRTEVSLER